MFLFSPYLPSSQNTHMILELAILDIIPNQNAAFEAAFARAQTIISNIPGYMGHELQHCLELENRYILLVKWERLEDHTIGFRQSASYQEWKALLHHFYSPFPEVWHFSEVSL